MINELNLTPHQTIVFVLVLLLLAFILGHIHNPIEIDLPERQEEPEPQLNPYHGAYLQSQSKYYN